MTHRTRPASSLGFWLSLLTSLVVLAVGAAACGGARTPVLPASPTPAAASTSEPATRPAPTLPSTSTAAAPTLPAESTPTATATASGPLEPSAYFLEAHPSGWQWTARIPFGDDPLRAAAFSPAGDWLLLGRTAWVQMLRFDAPSGSFQGVWGRAINTELGRNEPVRVAVAPAGQAAALVGLDGSLRLWDAFGADLPSPAGFTPPVLDIAFSPDGRLLAAATSDDFVPVWDVASGALRARLPLPASWASQVAFAPDGRSLAVGLFDTVVLYDLTTLQLTGLLQGHTDAVTALAFAPDGRTLASGGADRRILLWDLEHLSLLAQRPAALAPSNELAGHTRPLTRLLYAPDGARLFSTSEDRLGLLWEPASGRQLRAYYACDLPAEPEPGALAFQLLASGKLGLISAYPSGELVRQELVDGPSYRVIKAQGDIPEMVVSTEAGRTYPYLLANGQALALVSWEGVELRELPSGRVTRRLASEQFSQDPMFSYPFNAEAAALSPDGRWLAVSLMPGVGLRDSQTGQVLAPPDINAGGTLLIDLLRAGSLVNWKFLSFGQTFSPDGRWLALSTGDWIKVHDTVTGRTSDLFRWDPQIGSPARLAYAADGKRLAVGANTGEVLVIDTATGSEVQRLEGASAPIMSLAFSANGAWMGFVRGDQVEVYDATGRQLAPTPEHRFPEPATALAFSADGSSLAVSVGRGVVQVNLFSGLQSGPVFFKNILHHNFYELNGLAFTPSGAGLLIGLDFGVLALWDLDPARAAQEITLAPAAFEPPAPPVTGGQVPDASPLPPDDPYQVILRHNDDPRPWLYSSVTGRERLLFEDGLNMAAWQLAPGGKEVAYLTYSDPSAATCADMLVIKPLDGSPSRSYTTPGRCLNRLEWLDDQRLYTFSTVVPENSTGADCTSEIREVNPSSGRGRSLYSGSLCDLSGTLLDERTLALRIKVEYWSKYRAVLDLPSGKVSRFGPYLQVHPLAGGRWLLTCNMKDEYNGEGHCPFTLTERATGARYPLHPEIRENDLMEWTFFVSASPDGRYLLFKHYWGGFNIGGVQAARLEVVDTQHATRPARALTPRRAKETSAGLWTPDGRWLYFFQCDAQLDPFSGNSERQGCALMRREPDGSLPQVLADLPSQAFNPAWSPGGGRLLFVLAFTDQFPNRNEVWSVRPDGSDLHKISDQVEWWGLMHVVGP